MKTPYQRVKDWREKNKEKRKAQMLVFSAIRNGSLLRQNCVECGSKISEAHHNDYTKPLEVVWLCKEHHIEADKKRREKLTE